jgi:dTDP-4-amino-4,6-dideoxygalactose transaminase
MIPFNDLKPLQRLLADEISAAVHRVLASGWFILGPEVESFEAAFANYHSSGYAVGVANGTDAIELALRAGNVGPGDEVITVAHTAVATVCAIECVGATPVLVDIDSQTYTMDVAAVRAAISPRTKAIVPVHLYGNPANIVELSELAESYHLLLVEDCAQAHGACYKGRIVGTFGHLGAFSFYPTKNLGGYGDGGAIITNDRQFAERLRQLRNYGQTSRYNHVNKGINSRLDEIQAAILRVKLTYLDQHNQMRRNLAHLYSETLEGVTLPFSVEAADPVYHLYVIRHAERDRLRNALAARGVETLIHYPIPIHQQNAYAALGYALGSLPVTERVTSEILSLPMYIGLSSDDILTIGQRLSESLGSFEDE